MFPPSRPPRSLLLGILIVLIILGIGLRSLHPGHKIHMGDEIISSLRIAGHRVADMLDHPACTGEPHTAAELKTFLRPQSPPNPWPVLRSISEVGAQHPPFYFLQLWGWASLFGSSIGTLRGLSVLYGILCIPAMYFLGRELFPKNSQAAYAAAITATAIAVSPFHILYSQMARQSSLWILLTIVSNWALLRALRTDGDQRFWRIYGLTSLLNLYTFAFTGIIILGQMLFLRSLKGHHPAARYRHWFTHGKDTLKFLGLAYLPWALVSLLALRNLISATKHLASTEGMTRVGVFLTWLQSLGRLWVDLRYPLSPYPEGDWGRWLPAIAIAAFTFYVLLWLLGRWGSTGNLERAGERGDHCDRDRLHFLLSSLIFPGLLLIAADLTLGGDRSAEVRYWAPSWLALELAIAYFLSVHITEGSTWKRRLWSALTVGLLVASLGSSGHANAARLWWSNDSASILGDFPEEIRILNQEPPAPNLVGHSGWNRLLLFSYYLRDDVKLHWFCQSNRDGGFDTARLRPDESWIFYRPDGNLQWHLTTSGDRLEPIAPHLPRLMRFIPARRSAPTPPQPE